MTRPKAKPVKEDAVIAMLTPEGREARRCSVCGAESLRCGDRRWIGRKAVCFDGCQPIEAPK